MSDKNVTMLGGGCCGGKERQPARKPCKNKACGSTKTEAVSENGAKVWHCGYEATICPCNPCFCGKPIERPRKMFP